MCYSHVRREMKEQSGFTLIELLTVISIIGLLGSVVLSNVNLARARARDARKISDFYSIGIALRLFFEGNGNMPANYNPGFGVCEGDMYYTRSMQELITAGLLSQIPKTPGGVGSSYCWYNYGSGNDVGGLIVTNLEAAPDTVTGILPSCRPWAAGVNWCDMASNKRYCLCNPY